VAGTIIADANNIPTNTFFMATPLISG
jgi:hypothetical protein